MALRPTTEEWELAFIDRITNYYLDDQAGGVVTSPDDPQHRMACLLFEATHVEMQNTVRFMFRVSRNRLAELRTIVEAMSVDLLD